MQQLASPKHGLSPLDATVAIRSAPCVLCGLIAPLTSFANYQLTVRAYNFYGYGSSAITIGTPKEIPGAPSSITVAGNTGTSLLVTFTMPSIANQQITFYTVQWDTTPQFTNATSALASCASVSFGSCDLSGSAILSNPIQYVIQNLQLGVTYYIRVSASNSISIPVSLSLLSNNFSSTSVADNTNWSETVSYTTSNQQPDPPVLVVINENGPTNIQVLVTPPVNNGGLFISSYRFEYDIVTSFDSINYGFIDVPNSPLFLPGLLQNNSGTLIYELNNMTQGLAYFVRVSAFNSIGFGFTTLSTTSTTPASKPQAPSSVSINYQTTSTSPLSTLSVTWTAPSGVNAGGGSPLSGYLVEWWQSGSVEDVQLVQWTSTFFLTNPNGSFTLSYSPQPNAKFTTSSLSFDVSPWNLRSEVSFGICFFCRVRFVFFRT